MVSRPGFYTTEVEVAVLAQADPTVQNFVLSPDLPNPVALVADAGDEEVLLSWRPPGSEVLYDVSYYDDLFESEIGCNSGGCSWGVRFTPLSYPATLEGLVISIQGNQYSGGNSANAYVEAYLDPSGSVSGPTGDPITLIESTDLVSDMNELVQYSFDVSDVGVTIESGDLYIVVYEPANTTLLIAYDTEPVSSEYFDRNWIYIPDYYDYGWNPISDITTFVGDYGVLATFSGPPPAERSSSSYAVTASGSIVDLPQIIDGPLTNVNNNSEGAIASYSENILDDIYIPRPIPTMNRDGFRDDSLLAYKVYHVTADTTLLVSTTTDTLDTISVDENYVSYCYEVRAQWNTGDAPDGYGILESKPSNTACEIPFAFGDANFDSQTNLTDILAIVDFVLLETVPSDAAFRNSDVNKDGQLNIADIVIVVDIIYADPDLSLFAGRLNASSGLIDLEIDHKLLNLKVGLEYSGLLRGMEFSINYDPGFVNLNAPILNKMGENTLLSYNLIEAGLLKIIVADLKGSPINYDQDNFITIPYTFSGNNEQVSEVSIEGVIASGPKGEMINLSYRSSSTDIKLVPGVFALHQNYPNPFNPTTEIRFDLPEASFAEVAIYNLMGHKVKTLFNMNVKAGYHVISWNGTNDKGHMVSTGMYFYTLNTSKYHSMKKMLYLK